MAVWLRFVFVLLFNILNVGATSTTQDPYVYPCPKEWTVDSTTYNTWCYMYVVEVFSLSFSDSVQYCANVIPGGSAVLTIKDAAENRDVGSQIGGHSVWLGLVRRNGTWVNYADGSSANFFDWGAGEPSNSTEGECAAFQNDYKKWWWKAIDCTAGGQAIICKMPANRTLS